MKRSKNSWLSTIAKLGFTRREENQPHGKRRTDRRVPQLGMELLERRLLLSAEPFDHNSLVEWLDNWGSESPGNVQSLSNWTIEFSDGYTSAPGNTPNDLVAELSSEASVYVSPNSRSAQVFFPDGNTEDVLNWVLANEEIASAAPSIFGSFGDPVVLDEGYGGQWGLNNEGQDLVNWVPNPSDPNNPELGEFETVPDTAGFYDVDIDAPEAWDTTTGSTTVVIAVIDSGIDYTHPDLYRNIWINQGEIPDGFLLDLVDVDSDGLITFWDLNAAANWSESSPPLAFVDDVNGTGYIDAGDLLNPSLGWLDAVDDDSSGYADDLIGYDFNGNGAVQELPIPDINPLDQRYHGTHVAGIIGAHGNTDLVFGPGSVTSPGVAGINWKIQLMPLKIGSELGNFRIAAAEEAIRYATKMKTLGVNVVASNNSWGIALAETLTEESMQQIEGLSDAIAEAGEEDVLFVTSAGNNRNDNDGLTPNLPAGFEHDNVITVASHTRLDSPAFSTAYGTESVDIAAPGASILSTFPTYETQGILEARLQGFEVNTVYQFLSGTSMAAPMVTGVVALLAAADAAATGLELKEAIIDSAEPFEDGFGSLLASGGRLNANSAMTELLDDTFYVKGVHPAPLGQPTHELVVHFSDELLTGSVLTSNFSIQGAGGDGSFTNGGEYSVAISSVVIESATSVRITTTQEMDADLYCITLQSGGVNGLKDIDSRDLNDGVDVEELFSIRSAPGDFESNDTLQSSYALDISGIGSDQIEASIGDGFFGANDVDIYSFSVGAAGAVVSAIATAIPPETGSALAPLVRLFDSEGIELRHGAGLLDISELEYLITEEGTYYVGISSRDNQSYDASEEATGGENLTLGRYELNVEVSSLPDGISGKVFSDINASGSRSEGENGLAGVTVFIDANENGVLNAGETFVVTDKYGEYLFEGLAADDYRVAIIEPAQWSYTGAGPTPSRLETVQTDELTHSVDFGLTFDTPNSSSITVTTIGDHIGFSSTGTSLRFAMRIAADYEIEAIDFDTALDGKIIELTNGALVVATDVEIQGPESGVFLDAAHADRILEVRPEADVVISKLNMVSGYSPFQGGGVFNQGQLTIQDLLVFDSESGRSGGGIFNAGTLTASNVEIRGNRAGHNGGGIASEGILTVSTSEVTYNHADGDELTATAMSYFQLPLFFSGGGGIANLGGSIDISDSKINFNTANGSGGGLLDYLASGPGTISNTEFRSNELSAINVGDAISGGAGIASVGAGFVEAGITLTIVDSAIKENTAKSSSATVSSSGGGIAIYNGGSPLRNDPNWLIDSTLVSENSIVSAGRLSGGGGVYQGYDCVLTIENSTIDSNQALYRGGGLESNGSLKLSNSTVSRNSVAHTYYAFNSTAGTFVDQVIGSGGGVSIGGPFVGQVEIVNVTITGNSALVRGGGIELSATPAIDSILASSIIAGNSTTYISDIDIFLNSYHAAEAPLTNDIADQTFFDGGVGPWPPGQIAPMFRTSSNAFNNFIGEGYTSALEDAENGNHVGSVASPIDPLLGAIANYGGVGLTYALLPGSPALDAGSNSHATAAGLTTDQRGFSRFVNLPGVGSGNTIDIGAFEAGNDVTYTVSTLLDEQDSDYSFGDLSLREAIALGDALPGEATIVFDESLFGGTITLAVDSLTISEETSIVGPGADKLTIDGTGEAGNTSIIVTDTTARISGVTITGMDGSTLGAVAVVNSYLVFDGVSISDNDTFGVYVYDGGLLLMKNSTVANNTGNGITSTSSAGDQAYRNVTISGNTGSGYSYGGAGSIEIISSTITDNDGFGILSGIMAPMLLHNTIVADNNGLYDFALSIDSESTNNLLGTVTAVGGISEPQNGVHGQVGVANAYLAPLANFGGPTPTHALLETSTALNAGNNSVLASHGLTLDQRGLDRTVGTVDIGAFEAGNENTLTVSTISDDNDTNYSFGDFSLREAIALGAQIPGKEVIRFDESLLDGTIALTVGSLTILDPTDIVGLGADRLTIDGSGAAGNTSVIVTNTSASFSDITITGMDGSTLGALSVFGSDVALNGVSISDNDTFGIYIYDGGTLHAFNSTIAGNTGNGITSTSSAGEQTYLNVTISGNTASGLYDSSTAAITFVNSTIAFNTGAGVLSSGPGVLFYNSIVLENGYDLISKVNSISSHNLIGTSLIAPGSGGPEDGVHGMVGVTDPVLDVLDDYGGPTKTHALLEDSLAIDAGSNVKAIAFGLLSDQRGGKRFVDWDGVGGDLVDIGAVELAFEETYT